MEDNMKYLLTLAVVLFARTAFAQTPETTPTNIVFKAFPSNAYITTFTAGEEKVMYSRALSLGREILKITSKKLEMRLIPIPHTNQLGTGIPDTYDIFGDVWKQIDPDGVTADVPEKYRQYLSIGRKLSAEHWHNTFP